MSGFSGFKKFQKSVDIGFLVWYIKYNTRTEEATMEKAKMIHKVTIENTESGNIQIIVRGIKFGGEYDVDILYQISGANYVWRTVAKDKVICKRINTINKHIAAKGLNFRVKAEDFR